MLCGDNSGVAPEACPGKSSPRNSRSTGEGQYVNPPYYEDDYRRTVNSTGPTRLLPGTGVEIVREVSRQEPPKHAIFDFDGTLSLIRQGWADVMVPMMVEVLQATGTHESSEKLRGLALEFVMQLNGKQTIYQMIRLAEEVCRRGGTPLEPAVYKRTYRDRLMERIAGRREGLRCGQVRPEKMLVPFAYNVLDQLRRRDVALYLASGTDEGDVLEEAALLGLDAYFDGRIYGAREDYKSFSKAMVIERILSENRVGGAALLGFGDGYVEIQNVKAVTGTAVAVASDEAGRSGKPDPWKRDRLIGVGADVVIGDYRDHAALLQYLWGESEAKCRSSNLTDPG